MTDKKPARRRNLKTAKDVLKERSKPKRGSSVSRKISRFFGSIFSWLNQPVATSSGSASSPIISGLTKERSMFPRYIRESFQELKLVTWPSFKVALRLTTAVVIFATFFTVIVAVLDSALTEVFNQFILGENA